MFPMRHLVCFFAVTVAAAACSSDNKSSTPPGGGGSSNEGGTEKDAGSSGGKSSGGAGGSSGGSTGGGGTSAGGADSGTDGGDAGTKPVTFSGTTVTGVPGSNGHEAPLAGVTVCVVDSTGATDPSIPCVTSDASGKYAFPGLTPKQTLIISFSKAGYGTQIIAADIGTADATRSPMRLVAPATSDAGPDAGSETFGWDPSVVVDPAKGTLNTFAVVATTTDGGGTAAPGFDFAEGVSFAISPKSGVGPYYMDANEKYVPGATSSSGGYGAWFLNVTPGTVTVTATSATLNCSAVGGNGYGWAQADGSQKAPVFAGENTQSIGFFCTKK